MVPSIVAVTENQTFVPPFVPISAKALREAAVEFRLIRGLGSEVPSNVFARLLLWDGLEGCLKDANLLTPTSFDPRLDLAWKRVLVGLAVRSLLAVALYLPDSSFSYLPPKDQPAEVDACTQVCFVLDLKVVPTLI